MSGVKKPPEPTPAGVRNQSDTPAIRTSGLQVVVATFGTLDVAVVAFASQVVSPAYDNGIAI